MQSELHVSVNGNAHLRFWDLGAYGFCSIRTAFDGFSVSGVTAENEHIYAEFPEDGEKARRIALDILTHAFAEAENPVIVTAIASLHKKIRELPAVQQKRPCFYVATLTSEVAAEFLLSGTASLYNTKTGMLLIPNLVDGADKTPSDAGCRCDTGDWMYGLMSANIPPEKGDDLMMEPEESLEEFALDNIPAPGTCAPDRMEQLPVQDKDDLKALLADIFKECPDGWVAEA